MLNSDTGADAHEHSGFRLMAFAFWTNKQQSKISARLFSKGIVSQHNEGQRPKDRKGDRPTHLTVNMRWSRIHFSLASKSHFVHFPKNEKSEIIHESPLTSIHT